MPPAYAPTISLNRLVRESLPPEDGADFADAQRGFLGTIENPAAQRDYAFLDDSEAPPSVNPSLWRLARLNRNHGLFEVVPGIYQVRGFDIANITFIEGSTGLIALDALTRAEPAAALALYRRHRDPDGRRRLHTVMYSHSHGDHYGGVLGLATQAQVDAGEVAVIAPSGFLHHAIWENVIAGVPMRRRAAFQFGHTLPKGPEAQVDAGLGKTLGAGVPGLIAPTMTIEQPFETHVIDGVTIEFQLAPETEAPAEMHFYFPELRALDMAENTSHTMHNLCPLRGSLIRDALAWSKYLDEALRRYGNRVDVLLAQHHWPTWGAQNVRGFLAEQRDLYRVIHDQTVRLMSHGLKPAEIAETLKLPPGLERRWHARGYYGALSHNVKAVYQRYLSWYDGHPANLHGLPPVETARKTVEYMGGIDAVLARARADFERGEYRWVADVMMHAVYAHPQHAEARELAAAALEQLGFQAESATWRNAFLLGAHEYRNGPPKAGPGPAGWDIVAAMTNGQLFDALAVRLNPARVEGFAFTMHWHFTDSGEHWLAEVANGALHSHRCEAPGAATPAAAGAATPPAANVSIEVSRATLHDILREKLTTMQAVTIGQLRVAGEVPLASAFFAALDRFDGAFPVVDAARVT